MNILISLSVHSCSQPLICLSVHPHTCSSIHPHVHSSIHQSIYTPIHLSFHLHHQLVCPSIYPSMHISTCLAVHPSTDQHVCPSTYPSHLPLRETRWLGIHTSMASFNDPANKKKAADCSKRCFPRRAKAFFKAALRHLSSLKLWLKNWVIFSSCWELCEKR